MLKQGYKVETENIEENPQCPHGPTLIFQRLMDGEPCSRKFYACSACRDRKDCNFFLWCHEKLSSAAEMAWREEKKKISPPINLKSRYEEIGKYMIKTSCKESGFFCHSCLRLIQENVVNKEHRGHKIQGNIGSDLLKYPTKLLQARQDASKEAQFFFTQNALKCLENILISLKTSTFISIGTPRLAEHMKNSQVDIDVILLDLDWRYSIFYGDRFCWYNMFNHHFFGMEGDTNGKHNKQRFQDFVSNVKESEGSIVIVLDPPFGGRVEALAQTLHQIEKEIRDQGRTETIYYLWIYPYFMESYIKAELPESEMLDYKINYTNHPDYNQDSKHGLKQGSPVRIFTNAPSNMIILPTNEGYYLCSKCQKYVSRENKHCNQCNACTSKDGRTYVHCKKCRRCVKPTWHHCDVCQRCCLINHKCNSNNSVAPTNDSHNLLSKVHNGTRGAKKRKGPEEQFGVSLKKLKLTKCSKSLFNVESKKLNKTKNPNSKQRKTIKKKTKTQEV